MRSWIGFFLLVALTNALDQEFIDEFMDRVQEVGAACAEEVHATGDDIAELLDHKIPPTSHEARCMIFCVQKNFKIMKEDGSLDKVGSMTALKPLQKADPQLYQKILKIFVTCGMRAKVDPDPCETATQLAICGKEEAEKAGLDASMINM